MKPLTVINDEPAASPGPFALSESAAHHVNTLLLRERANRPNVSLLRVGVRGGGCSGLSYFMEFVEDSEPGDHCFDFYGVRVCVDAKSLKVLNGTTLDYGQKLAGAGFQWRNPNMKKACGCGESFAI